MNQNLLAKIKYFLPVIVIVLFCIFSTSIHSLLEEVIDDALPVRGNKNYSKNGSMTQPQLQSVLVDLRG